MDTSRKIFRKNVQTYDLVRAYSIARHRNFLNAI